MRIRIPPAVLVAIACLLLGGCKAAPVEVAATFTASAEATVTLQLLTTPSPPPSPKPVLTHVPSTPTPAAMTSPTVRPTATAVPLAARGPLEGYWVQNTSADGLCTDYPRFAGPYIAGGDALLCGLGRMFRLEKWNADIDGPPYVWMWAPLKIPSLGRIVSGEELPHSGGYPQPNFVGAQGQCRMSEEGQWQCQATRGMLPFSAITHYAVQHVDLYEVIEWYASETLVVSRGHPDGERRYDVPILTGVPGTRVTALLPPRGTHGRLWIGTDIGGVLEVDPETDRVTQHTSAHGVPGGTIRDIQQYTPADTQEDIVCMATPAGIGCWNGTAWQRYTVQDGLPSDDVRGLTVGTTYPTGKQVVLWAATAGGPAVKLEGTERWQAVPGFPTGIRLTGVTVDRAYLPETYGSVDTPVFMTRGQGLLRFMPGHVALGSASVFTTTSGLPNNQVTAIVKTARGVLAGTRAGAAEWDGSAWTLITRSPVSAASETLLATEGGLWAWQDGAWRQVSQIRVEAVSGPWYATAGQVCRWQPEGSHCLSRADGQSLTSILALYADPGSDRVAALDVSGKVWVNTDKGYGLSPQTQLSFDPPDPRRVPHDLLALNGYWLLATSRGLFAQQAPEGFLVWPAISGGWPLQVRQVRAALSTGALWLATNQGAFYTPKPMAFLEGTHEEQWFALAGLSARDITAVLPVDTGAWLGTANSGVIYWQPDR